jgi:NagD protein
VHAAVHRANARTGIGCTFLTNNPSKSSNDYLAHLRKMGLAATSDELYTSAQATIDCLRRRFPEVRKIFALGTPEHARRNLRGGASSSRR